MATKCILSKHIVINPHTYTPTSLCRVISFKITSTDIRSSFLQTSAESGKGYGYRDKPSFPLQDGGDGMEQLGPDERFSSELVF